MFTPESLWAMSEFLMKGIIKINDQNQMTFDWEDENFAKIEVKELMQNGFSGFERATPEGFYAVAEFLINEYSFKKVKLKTLIRKSFSSFYTCYTGESWSCVRVFDERYNKN